MSGGLMTIDRGQAFLYEIIGFPSYSLTYYVIYLHSSGRSPLHLWKELDAPILDLPLGAMGLLGGT
jgi:hypothetical protein